MSDYDVYHQWLGIPPEHQPPSLYRLLGLADFEQDVEVIRNAAERQAMHVRRLARGEFTDAGQHLLNEIAEAKLKLLNVQVREAYDSDLREIEQKQTQRENTTTQSVENQVKPSTSGLQLQEPQATLIDIDLAGKSSAKTRWIIGYHPDCDCRIDGDTISGIHCQVKLTQGRLILSDLKSTNGTYVNQQRIQDATEITSLDLLTLGRGHRIVMPFDQLPEVVEHPATAIFVGRGDGNELQLDSPTVSRFHARLIVTRRRAIVEDLNSKQGVFIIRDGGERSRIQRCQLRDTDTICLGDVNLDAQDVFELIRNR